MLSFCQAPEISKQESVWDVLSPGAPSNQPAPVEDAIAN
ncbi:PonB [Pasteurella multocida subsp. multocida str. Anand1_buffalo]|nr:PonB [Pasteurella multocida subsp. multocida str. Anand1_buffalo]